MEENLDEIIAGCIAGDRQCQEDLYRVFSPGMYAVCRQYASDAGEASDFLQEGFIRVFSNIGNYRGEGHIGAWIRRIMVNTALQMLRKKRHLYVVNEEITEDEDKPYEDPDCDLGAEDLLEMISSLPVNQRMVFNLFAIEGYNHCEISEMTGIPENTCKSHLHRARMALQRMIEKESGLISEKIRKNV